MKRSKSILWGTAFAVFFFVIPILCFAQPPGVNELKDVTTEIKKDYSALSRLIAVIGAVTGTIGGVRVYSNWQTGQQRIDAQVIGWFCSCLFLNLAALYIKGLYGV